MPQLLLAIFFIRNLYYLDYLKKKRLEELTIFVEELFWIFFILDEKILDKNVHTSIF